MEIVGGLFDGKIFPLHRGGDGPSEEPVFDRNLIAGQNPGQFPGPAPAGGITRRFQQNGLGEIDMGDEKPLPEFFSLGISMVERLLDHALVGFFEELLVKAGFFDFDDSGKGFESAEQFGVRFRELRISCNAEKDKG
jgi:hypothetical protein